MPPPPTWLLVTTICAYWAALAFKGLFWFLARRAEARTKRLPPPWECPRCGLKHRIATCSDVPDGTPQRQP